MERMPQIFMKYNRNDFILVVTLLVLLILLPVMAVLQYRWLGQLSEAEMVRTRSNLQISAERLAEDFDRQLTGIYNSFSIPFGKNITLLPRKLENKLDELAATGGLPQLISNIFFVRIENENPRIFLFDRTAKKMILQSWPDSLQRIRKQLSIRQNNGTVQVFELTQGPMLGEVPMVVISDRIPFWFGEYEKQDVKFSLLIITLNRDQLKNVLMPELIKKHFSRFEDLEFNIAIAGKGSNRILFYSSVEELELKDYKKPDFRTPLGRLRAHDMLFAKAIVDEDSVDQQHVFQNYKKRELSIKVMEVDTTTDVELTRYFISDKKGWELLVKHRGGNLEVAIEAARNRNLFISFSILLFLGISLGFVLISTHRAQRLARQQMEFVAGVSHELRTPLSVIRTAGENLIDGVIKSGPQLKKYGKLIRDEGKRLSDMVERILAFSGIRSGNKVLHPEPVEINSEVKCVADQFKKENSTENMRITLKLENTIPPVWADRSSFRLVLNNLLNNALKYSNGSPVIEIRSDSTAESGKVSIEISDSGIGISGKDLKKIFEPFYRTREAVDRQISGSGLGLSLVKRIVEWHGGRVAVSSIPGTGSVFKLYWPVAEDA